MRVAVLGAGALGSLFGGRLAAAGVPVTLISTRAEHIAAIRSRGLTITGPGPGEKQVMPVAAATDPAAAGGPFDLVLLTVKAPATGRALETIGPLLGPETLVLTLQNGLGNAEAVAARVGSARTLVGVTAQGARMDGPGRIHHAGGGLTEIGPYWEGPAAEPERVAAVAGLIRRAGFAVEVLAAPEVRSAVWTKLLVNAGINALTALLGVANGRLPELPSARELVAAAVAEGAAVARALGIPLRCPDPVAHTLAVAAATGANRSSMLADVERRRPTEVMQINGAIAAAAERLGLAAPVNRTLALLIRALEESWGTMPEGAREENLGRMREEDSGREG
nr:MAG: 2-dehydropantoate 2-reductase [Bacillota bacterium]